jgi:hypothetical protein
MPAQAHPTTATDDTQSIISTQLSELGSTPFSERGSEPSIPQINFCPSTTNNTTTTARKRKQTATTTWEHSKKQKTDEIQRDKHGNKLWICAYCDSWATGALTTARYHLEHTHNISIEPQQPKATRLSQNKLEDIFNRTGQVNLQRQERKEIEVLKSVINEKAFFECLIQLLLIHNLPHTVVEWPLFQAMLMTINYTVDSILPRSRAAIPRAIEQSFLKTKHQIKQRLQSSISSVHLSADVWTSPNKLAFVAIIAHFVDEDKVLQKALLGLPQLYGSHGGEHQAFHISKVIDDYELAPALGYFVGDNHGSNDKLCRFVSIHLRDQHNLNWHPDLHRIRCQGHVINIVAQAFLFARSKAAVDEAVDATIDNEDTQVEDNIIKNLKKQRDEWRKIGPMGKLHNIVVYIRNSELHYNAFVTQAGRSIPLDNDTRWNSWFIMLDVSLKLRPHVNAFIEANYRSLEKDFLTPADWELLEQIRLFLQPFWKVTQRTQGDLDSIDKTLSTMDILVRHFEKSHVSTAFTAFIQKLSCLGQARQ